MRVNSPLSIDGTLVHLLNPGYAPQVTVRDGRGAVVHQQAVPFLPQDQMFTSTGVVKVPRGGEPDIGVQGIFLPTGIIGPNGPESVFPGLGNPVLVITAWQGDLGVELEASTEDRVVAALDVFKDKLVRRGVSLKALDAGEPRASGKVYKISAVLQDGLTSDQAKRVAKIVRDGAPKGVKATQMGDEVRVSSKKRDDLQATIALLKGEDFDFAVQFVNYR